MARSRKNDMVNLEPINNGSSIKIDKVTITHEKSGSSKIRFSFNGKTFSHGVGRLDNKLSLNQVIETCKNITLDLRMKRFKPDTWKMDYFGIDSNSKVINFSNQNTVSKSAPIKSELTLIDVWENYLSVKGDNFTYNTLQSGIKHASNHLNYAHSIDPNCVYLDNIDRFVAILKAKYADSTSLKDFSFFGCACNLAMKQGKIKGNPFSVYLDKLSQQPKNGLGALLSFTKQEKELIVKTFYDNPYPIASTIYTTKDGTKKTSYRTDSKERAAYYAPLIELKFLTGMRPGEAHSLKWSDIVDHGTPVIMISKSCSIDGKKLGDVKNGIKHYVPINADLANLIDRLPRIPNEKNLIFPNPAKTSLPYIPTDGNRSYPSHFFGEIVNGLFNDGLIEHNLTYYCTRHYFATQLIRAGKDVATVASWLGDKKETVMNYYYAPDYTMSVPCIL